MGGLRCHACRRYVLRRVHFVFLAVVALALAVGLIEIIGLLTPPPLKSH
jgi:hypothetical protein